MNFASLLLFLGSCGAEVVLGKQGENVLLFSLAGLVEEIGSEDPLTWVLALVLILSAWIITGNLLLLFRKSEEGFHFYLE